MDKQCSFVFKLLLLNALGIGLKGVCAINLASQGLTSVPHDVIDSTETTISLQYNKLTQLGDGEFSAYPSLTTTNFMTNPITFVSPTAFAGTSLDRIILRGTSITQFPDLLAVKDTLTSLTLSFTPMVTIDQALFDLPYLETLDLSNIKTLTGLPDFSTLGTQTTPRALYLSGVGLEIAAPTTFCQFQEFRYGGEPLNHVPEIVCDASANLNKLTLTGKGYDSQTDFSNITALESLKELDLSSNDGFPDIPQARRAGITRLTLKTSNIVSVPAEKLEGYSGTNVDVESNYISSLPFEAFKNFGHISLTKNTAWSEYSSLYWGDALCGSSVTGVVLSNVLDYLPQLYNFARVQCAREQLVRVWGYMVSFLMI